jgi:hypothetical protein
MLPMFGLQDKRSSTVLTKSIEKILMKKADLYLKDCTEVMYY